MTLRLAKICSLIAAALVFGGGCSFEFSTGSSLSAEDAAKKAKSSLNEVLREEGAPPITEITCPEDLDEEEGATIRCDAVSAGEEIDVVVTVSEVDGDRVNLDFETVESTGSAS
jgi:Domain of unknown function (DUF4333)